MNDSVLGLSHFLSQADSVARFILILMLIASLLTWGIVTDRLVKLWLLKRRSKTFFARFLHVDSFAGLMKNSELGQNDPYSRLTRNAIETTRHYAAYDASHLNAAGGLPEFLIRSLRQCIEEEAEQLEHGLTILASIGSTAPFVGLFGTVWGIYHALLSIGISGQGTLDKIAGPVGEALIMTAIGLVVAIPAVLGYNALVRRNRIVLSRLDAFGHDLLTLVVTGAPLERSTRAHTHIRAVRAAGGA
jgi:biopolymer transport protein ExbB